MFPLSAVYFVRDQFVLASQVQHTLAEDELVVAIEVCLHQKYSTLFYDKSRAGNFLQQDREASSPSFGSAAKT